MTDLIDRNELLKVFEEDYSDNAWWFIDQVENAPKVEAEPVRYGHWEPIIKEDDFISGYRCSCCKWRMLSATNYCSHCGAKMRKEDV